MSLVLISLGAMCGMFGNPDPPRQEKRSDPLGILYGLCNIHCTTFTVFLHYGFGSEALGFPGMFALILLFFCMAGDPRMMYWLVAFLVTLVIQRLITVSMLRRGCELHSLSNGWPLIAKLLPFVRKRTSLIVIEVLLCFLAGACMMGTSEFIGKYLMLGGVSLFVRTVIEESVARRRVQRMRDAELEQRWLSERFRARDGY
jgi:hypothetical protein